MKASSSSASPANTWNPAIALGAFFRPALASCQRCGPPDDKQLPRWRSSPLACHEQRALAVGPPGDSVLSRRTECAWFLVTNRKALFVLQAVPRRDPVLPRHLSTVVGIDLARIFPLKVARGSLASP